MRSVETLTLTVAGLAALLLAPLAFAQVTADGPIKGTITVNDGADYAALAKVTAEQARDAALAQVPGSTFVEAELDEEDGFLVYEVELRENGKGVEVTIDAGNAALRIERDED
jgi:uncharacterized membrane protein YkoI